MGVKKRGSSYQVTVNYRGDRYRRQFTTEHDANVWEVESKAKLLRGEKPDMGEAGAARGSGGLPFTLGELIQHTYDVHWKTTKGGDKQLANAKDIVSHIGPAKPIAKLNKADIDKARVKLLDGGNQPGTVNRKVAALSRSLTEAVDLDIIDKKPKCAKYSEAEHRIRRFTPEEETSALNYWARLGNQDMADYIVLAVDTGLRQSELLVNAQFRDVREGRITVVGAKETLRDGSETTGSKSGKTRTVPLTKRAQAVIERRRASNNSQRIFEGVSVWSVQHWWVRMSEAMDLEHDRQFVPHIMRHEFCSRLADRGCSAPIIMALAGHSALTVSQKYIHVGGQALDTAIWELDSVVEPTPKGIELDPKELAGMSAVELLQKLAAAGVQLTQRD